MENKNETMKAIVKTTGEVVTTGTIGTVSATGMISAGASAVMLATGISEINQLPKKATIGILAVAATAATVTTVTVVKKLGFFKKSASSKNTDIPRNRVEVFKQEETA